jgi:hypothetical protein
MLLDSLTGTADLIGACRCASHGDAMRHTVLLFTTEELIWARETMFSKPRGGPIPWRTVRRVEAVQSAVANRIELETLDGAIHKFQHFTGRGLPLRERPVTFDVNSLEQLIRERVAAATA